MLLMGSAAFSRASAPCGRSRQSSAPGSRTSRPSDRSWISSAQGWCSFVPSLQGRQPALTATLALIRHCRQECQCWQTDSWRALTSPIEILNHRTEDDCCHSKESALSAWQRMMTTGVCVGQRRTCVPPSQLLALLAVKADPGWAAGVPRDPQIQLCVVWQDDRPAGPGNSRHHTSETLCTHRIIQKNISLPICQPVAGTCRPQQVCGILELLRERQVAPRSRGCRHPDASYWSCSSS